MRLKSRYHQKFARDSPPIGNDGCTKTVLGFVRQSRRGNLHSQEQRIRPKVRFLISQTHCYYASLHNKQQFVCQVFICKIALSHAKMMLRPIITCLLARDSLKTLLCIIIVICMSVKLILRSLCNCQKMSQPVCIR
jgi:hypothetical protein